MVTRSLSTTFFKTSAPPPSIDTAAALDQNFAAADAGITYVNDQFKAGDAAIGGQVKQLSHQVKSEFCGVVSGMKANPALADEASKTALYAVASGLMAGALDGALIMASPPQTAPPTPAPPSAAAISGDKVKQELEKVLKELEARAQELGQKAKQLGPQALQATAAASKQASVKVVNQADRFTGSSLPVVAYQSYLTSAFAVGYTVGMNDAALLVVAQQPPGPWK